MLKAAEACHKIGKTFGIGLGVTADCVDTAGALFAAFGAEVMNDKGNITVKSDAVREVLEYAQKLVKFLPADAVSYDDASNNRALISGQSALILNPPSAWAVAKRDAPTVAADCWTFPAPKGPKGRFVPQGAFFWGVWNFSPNKSAAKELIEFLMQREQVEARCNAALGYDMPPFASMTDFKIWDEVEPPKGTVYQLPDPQVAASGELYRGGAGSAGYRGADLQPRHIADDVRQAARAASRSSRCMAWAQDELEGFTR